LETENKINISIQYLQIDFANSLDTKPHFYYNKNGRELLDETDMSVSEIADSLGFSNVDTMIKGFKKYAGITPGKYRKWDT